MITKEKYIDLVFDAYTRIKENAFEHYQQSYTYNSALESADDYVKRCAGLDYDECCGDVDLLEYSDLVAESGTKYYIVELEERNGEYEYTHVVKTFVGNESKTEDVLKEIVKNWYCDEDAEYNEAHEGYYFNCGDVFVKLGRYEEVSEELYRAIPLISEL